MSASLLAATAANAQADRDADLAREAALLADARARTSLQASGTTSGHDGRRFFLASPDRDYRLDVGGYTQFRYIANFRDEIPDGDKEFANGFEIRRTRLSFSGNVIDPNLTFRVLLALGDPTVLLDAWGRYRFENGWAIRWGQYKLPLLREETMGSSSLLAVERSVVNAVFTVVRSQGVELTHAADDWRIAGVIADGSRAANAPFFSGAEADWSLTGRAEWKWAGEWRQLNDFTSWRGSDPAGMLGGAVHYQSGGDTAGTADLDVLLYTADVSIEGDGWNAYGAFVGRRLDAAGSPGAFHDFGFLAQAGVFLTDRVELFGRYDVVIPDSDRGAADDPFNTITAGVNCYFVEHSHAAKLTIDTVWFLDSQAGSGSIVRASAGSVGLLADSADSDYQVAIRAQFVLMF